MRSLSTYPSISFFSSIFILFFFSPTEFWPQDLLFWESFGHHAAPNLYLAPTSSYLKFTIFVVHLHMTCALHPFFLIVCSLSFWLPPPPSPSTPLTPTHFFSQIVVTITSILEKFHNHTLRIYLFPSYFPSTFTHQLPLR